jgi:hypothetical protein
MNSITIHLFILKMTNLLGIIRRLFLIKTHTVLETGVCLHHQVKDTCSAGPNRQTPASEMLCVLIKNRQWITYNRSVVLTIHHHHKPSEFTIHT